jgi:galactose mutarotase-like enzyme
MDIKDYIQEQLKSGKTMEEILNSVAATANEVEAQQKADSKKVAEADKLAEDFRKFTKTYYPKLKVNENKPATGKDIVELFDSLDSLTISVDQFVRPRVQKAGKTIDDIINDFLKEIC